MCVKSDWIKFSILILCVISMITFYSVVADADNFKVKVVYFKPVGSEPLEERLADKMEKVQQFYQDEMVRHGFGPKTFRLERDNNGKVKIHVVNAQLEVHALI